jgi:hypothetical protein
MGTITDLYNQVWTKSTHNSEFRIPNSELKKSASDEAEDSVVPLKLRNNASLNTLTRQTGRATDISPDRLLSYLHFAPLPIFTNHRLSERLRKTTPLILSLSILQI